MSGPNPGESDLRGRSPAGRIGQTSNNQPSDNEHTSTRNCCSNNQPSDNEHPATRNCCSNNQPSDNEHPATRNCCSSASPVPKASDDVNIKDPSAAGDSNSNQGHPRQGDDILQVTNSASEAEYEDLVYGAQEVISLFVPVTLCMLIVVASIASINFSESGVLLPSKVISGETEEEEEEEEKDTRTTILAALTDTGIILGLVISVTFVLLSLYLYRCYKILYGWLIAASVILLFVFLFAYIHEVFQAFNAPLDVITTTIIVWNIGMGGIFCIHWKGPLILQQAYLILISALAALTIIKFLPGWTTWTVLGVLIVWDLIAVLCPNGPLRMLVETAESRDEPIFPALIYSSAMVWKVAMARDGNHKSQNKSSNKGDYDYGNDDEDSSVDGGHDLEVSASSRSAFRAPGAMARDDPPMQRQVPSHVAFSEAASGESSVDLKVEKKKESSRSASSSNMATPAATANEEQRQKQEKAAKKSRLAEPEPVMEEETSINLGLGDFIFYSVLVGKASLGGDWNTTIACCVAILVGLCCTLLLLAFMGKALPALPISLTFGLVFYFATSNLVQPFIDKLNSVQVYI